MEYTLRLSEIIDGLEKGSWLDGASFENDEGNSLTLKDGELFNKFQLDITSKWRFVKYVD